MDRIRRHRLVDPLAAGPASRRLAAKFFETALTRTGATDWPAAGAPGLR